MMEPFAPPQTARRLPILLAGGFFCLALGLTAQAAHAHPQPPNANFAAETDPGPDDPAVAALPAPVDF